MDIIIGILSISLDFRSLCKRYFLNNTQNADSEDSDDELTHGSGKDDTTLLNLESLQFADRYNKCKKEFEQLVNSHRTRMKVLTALLKKHTKKGVYNYLNEAFIRFNFNNFYISREDEELE
jgi:hypothetical protein